MPVCDLRSLQFRCRFQRPRERLLAILGSDLNAVGAAVCARDADAGTITYKQVGAFSSNGPGTPYVPGYGTFNGSAAYDFGRFKLKLQVLKQQKALGFMPLDKKPPRM